MVAWRQPTQQMLDECVAWLQGVDSEAAAAPPTQLQQLCRAATFTDAGVRWLNARAVAAVRRFRKREAAAAGGGSDALPYRLSMLDSYASTQGQHWATADTDGRHYVPIIPLQLQATLHKADVFLRTG